jgi:hypothetical protein
MKRRQFPAAALTLHVPDGTIRFAWHRIRAATARLDPVGSLHTNVCKAIQGCQRLLAIAELVLPF